MDFAASFRYLCVNTDTNLHGVGFRARGYVLCGIGYSFECLGQLLFLGIFPLRTGRFCSCNSGQQLWLGIGGHGATFLLRDTQ